MLLDWRPGLRLTVLTLGALLSERREENTLRTNTLTKGSVSHMQTLSASAHHVIAASVLLNADVALGTLRRQKGAIRLTHHQLSSKKNYRTLQAPVPSSSSQALLGRWESHLNVAGR